MLDDRFMIYGFTVPIGHPHYRFPRLRGLTLPGGGTHTVAEDYDVSISFLYAKM